jgi:hypothetical protein
MCGVRGGMTSQALGGVNSPCGWYRVRGQPPTTGGQVHTHTRTHTHAPPCFWHRTCGFLKARCLWEPGSSLTTGEFSFSAFCQKFLLRTSIGLNTIHTFLVNRLIVACLMTASSCFAQGNSGGLPCYEILCSGILNVPLPYGMRLKVSHK